MRIVVLDGYPLNPGDLSWDPLKALGECMIYERTDPSQLLERCNGADAVLTNKTKIDGDSLAELPALRYIGVLATGFNVVDIVAAARKGVVVTNVPAYASESVAQMVFAHMLNIACGLAQHSGSVRTGRWAMSRDWSYWETDLTELSGLTLGIVGYGRIGRAVGRLGTAFGMRVIAVEPGRAGKESAEGVEFVGLDDLFRQSDVVTLHCPLTDATSRIVNRDRLAMMKPTAMLINTSRGGLVDEEALADALRRHAIAGAGLDVLAVEPPAETNELTRIPSCHITPHIAWATQAARRRLLHAAVDNVAAFLSGHPINVVSFIQESPST